MKRRKELVGIYPPYISIIQRVDYARDPFLLYQVNEQKHLQRPHYVNYAPIRL